MSNGYLLASGPDLPAAHEISIGFGLEVIDAARVGDAGALAQQLAGAANVGVLLSAAAARDAHFVALLRVLGARLQTAQLIFADQSASTAFAFLPAQWPALMLDDARSRAARRRAPAPAPEPPPAAAAPEPEPPPEPELPAPEPEPPAPEPEPEAEASAPEPELMAQEQAPPASEPAPEPAPAEMSRAIVHRKIEDTVDAQEPEPAPQAGAAQPEPPPRTEDEAEFTPLPPQAAPSAPSPSAPADATAFAPKKLRRATPELVRVVIHQPSQAKDVIKAAKKIDPNARPAPQGMSIGDIALGANVGIALEVSGARCEGALQRRSWAGEPIDFSFSVEPDGEAKQAVFLARVFVDDAQIGVLAFTRPIVGGVKEADSGEIRLTRHKRVFISYSSADRAAVSAIATAYRAAGVEHFWDRASLKSGEEWSPRLRKEIERADLFHLCWSKAASQSEWVAKEAEHALKRRRSAKRPDITVQMLDGPPWAPHPPALDAINFDDFVRAAIVGYARGDGG